MEQLSEAFRAFGSEVRRRRRDLGLTQEGLAELCDLHRTYVGSIERGERNISLANIVVLAKALHTTSANLVAHVDGARA